MVGRALHHVHVVGHQHERQPAALLYVGDEVEQLGPQGAVQCGGRFIRQDDVGAVGQRHGDEDPLLLPSGKPMGVGGPRPSGFGKLYLTEEAQDLLLCFLSGNALVAPDHLGDLLTAAHGRVEAGHGLLEHHGDGSAPRNGHQGLAIAGSPAAIRPVDAARGQAPSIRQESQGRHAAHGLAGPALPDQGEGASGLQRKVNVMQDSMVPDGHGDPIPLQCRACGIRGCHAGPARVQSLRRAP